MIINTKSLLKKPGKIYVICLFLFCSLLLLSVDECDNMEEFYAMERAAGAREQQERAARAEQQRAARARAEQAARTKAEQEQAARAQAEQDRIAAASRTTSPARTSENRQTGTSQTNQAAASSPQTAATATQGTAGTGTAGTAGTTGTGTQNINNSAGQQGTDTAQTGSTGASYVRNISGREWKLTELRFPGRTITLNRNELSAETKDIFTLTIDNERVSGKGHPNRYFSAYRAGNNNTLTILPIASTMMASIHSDPQRIREEEYFQYLGKVKSWRINQNKLELTSADSGGKDLIMVFVR